MRYAPMVLHIISVSYKQLELTRKMYVEGIYDNDIFLKVIITILSPSA